MFNGFLAFVLGVALQFAGGALASLRPLAAARLSLPPVSVAAPPGTVNAQGSGPITATLSAVGGFDFCLGTDPQALRQAAAEALGVTPEALTDEIREGRTLAEVAEAHGVSRADLLAALQAAAQDDLRAQLDPLVADGGLTQEQADALLALQATRDLAPLLDLPFFFAVPALPEGGLEIWPDNFPGLPGGLPGFGEVPALTGPGGFAFRFHFEADGAPFTFELNADAPAVRAAQATALGLTEDELAARLDAGESLAEIAAAQGVDPAALNEAWREAGLAQARAELDMAVADGTLTQAQADEIYGQIEQSLSGAFTFPDLPGRFLNPEGGWPFRFQFEETPKPTS